MPETLLLTKLFIPPLRPKLVLRQRLIERLNQGLQLGYKLTLVSAPAGFGKTTLVSEWLDHLRLNVAKESQTKHRISWLSLDEGDNNPQRFLTYFITALNRTEGLKAPIGEGALGMLQSPQAPPTEGVLTTLINDVVSISDRILLVLDAYSGENDHLFRAMPITQTG